MGDRYTDRFFTEDSINTMIMVLLRHYPELDIDQFKRLIYTSNWHDLLVMKRVRHLAICLHKVLPESFKESVGILLKAEPEINWWESVSFPDFVGLYGQNDWQISMSALAEFTKYSTSEFAIRPFLMSDPERAAAFLEKLTDDKNENVRRFASEGCRPRLPWGCSLPLFKKDPSLILPILEKLKNDNSEFVRKSVANNLNDISKDNADTVLEIAERWYGKTTHTDWIVKHACRTLLKKGDRRALSLFGFGNINNLTVYNFELDKEAITLGERMTLSCFLDVNGEQDIKVRLEYGVYYKKANGSLSRKVWKISEKTYSPGSYKINKGHNFVDRTTRKHYEGTHCISLIVNGVEKAERSFQLKK